MSLRALPTSAGARLGVAAWLFVGRSLRRDLRDVEALLMAVILPVMMMLAFVVVLGGAISPGGDYLDYVVPGVIVTCAGFGAASTAVAVSQDMSTGAVDRFRTMPFASGTVLVGHTAASLVRNLLATAVVVAVGIAIGFRPTGGVGHWLAVAGIVAAYILAITSVFALIGLLSGSPQAASGYGFVLLFLPYMSSAFAPIETMPGWLQGFARNQPITPIIESTRALMFGQTARTAMSLGLLWSAGITIAALALVFWSFPRRTPA